MLPSPGRVPGMIAQQADNGAAPYGLYGLLFEEEGAPDAVLNVETATRDGYVDMRVLIELMAISVQGAQNMSTSMPSLLACLSMARVAQRKSSLSRCQLSLKKGQSRCGMVKVKC